MNSHMIHDLFASVRCVLLDLDGTLVDSNESHVKAWHEAFGRHDRPVAMDEIRQQIGKGGDQLIPSLLPQASDTERAAMAAAHDEIFRERYLSDVRAFAGASDFVASLHQRKIDVVLASSATQVDLDHYIELLQIRQLLTATTCADDVARSKPARDIFAVALEKAKGVSPAEALVIGDTPYDVIAATKCGIATVAVLSGGFSEECLRDAGARAVVEDIADLLDALNPDSD